MWILWMMFCAALQAQFAGEYRGNQMQLTVRAAGKEYTGAIQFQGESMPFTAVEANGKLQGRFQSQGAQFPFELRRDGSGFVLSTAGEEYRLEAAQPPAQAQAKNPLARPQLAGTWKHATGTLTFDAAGNGTSNGSAFRYRVEGDALILTDDQATLRFTYVLEGDTLRLTGPTGVQLVLTRSTGEAAAAVSNVDLSGKWCYVANVNATGGGARSTNQCFTLHANGRYEYYGETDSYGPNGGATSQGSDAGTWTATATSITSRSASGRVTTFQLERRNHPKTNDPMLVLNGQTFVTFYQKAPWRN
ncbi:MAG: hypothetical protein U0R19_23030 [Bryobacteraceae bacterium]